MSSAKVGSTSPPTTWSVDEVVKFMEKSELAEHADMFKKHVSKDLQCLPRNCYYLEFVFFCSF